MGINQNNQTSETFTNNPLAPLFFEYVNILKAHHFHKEAGEMGEPIKSVEGEILFEVGSGAQCMQCHMPGRTYMGADYHRTSFLM